MKKVEFNFGSDTQTCGALFFNLDTRDGETNLLMATNSRKTISTLHELDNDLRAVLKYESKKIGDQNFETIEDAIGLIRSRIWDILSEYST